MLNRRALLQAGLAAPAALALPVWAQTAPTLPSPGFRRLTLGDIEVIALNDGISRRALGEEFVKNAPLAEVRALLASHGLPTDTIDVPYNPFVVIAGGRRMLMDAGLGEFGGASAGKLLANLRAAGLQAGDIDTVLISHFHGDHIQGLRSKAGELVFPNAEVWVPEPEWAYWMDDARAAAASDERSKGLFVGARRVFSGMSADKLKRFAPGSEVVPGVRSMAAYGHTPGHTLFEAGSPRQPFVYLADLTNVPELFARNPDWAVAFDMDAEVARRVRRAVFERVVASGATVGGFHFPFPAFGTIERSGDGYAFKPVA